jgi:uncharacterized repeat protein (TIGR01451 family)
MRFRDVKRRGLYSAMAAMMALVPLTAFADFLNVTGDGVLATDPTHPFSQQFAVDLGTVCAGTDASKSVQLSIQARDHSGDGSFVFQNGASVTVSVISVTGSGLSVSPSPNAGTIILPSNWTSLPDGTQSSSITSTLTLNTSVLGPFTGQVFYSGAGPNLGGATLFKETYLTVTANVVSCGAPDVKVLKTADSGTINAGDTASFTIVVSNIGTADATNVTLSDPLPAGVTWTDDSADCSINGGTLSCSFGTLAVGASKTIHVSGATSPVNCGVLNNTVTVAASNEGADKLANNTSSASITVVCTPDIKVVKTAVDPTINRGDTAAFTIVVTNIGNANATGVTLNDPLPSGIAWTEDSADCSISGGVLSCNFGSLAAGASKTVHVSGSTANIPCGELTNTVTVAATNEPSDKRANNTSSATISVACAEIGTPGFWRNWRNHYSDSQMQTLINYLKTNNAAIYNKDGKNGTADDLTIAKVDAIYDFKDGDGGVSRSQMILAQLTALKLNLAVTQLEGVNGIQRLLPKVCSNGVVNVSSISGASAFFGSATPTIATEYTTVESKWTGKLTTNPADWSFNMTDSVAGSLVIPVITGTNGGTLLLSNGC